MTQTAFNTSPDGLQKSLSPLGRPEIERGNDLLIQAMRQAQDERPARPDKMIPLVFRYVERVEDQLSVLTEALKASNPEFAKAYKAVVEDRTGS